MVLLEELAQLEELQLGGWNKMAEEQYNWLLLSHGVVVNAVSADQDFIDTIKPNYEYVFRQDQIEPVGGNLPDVGWLYDGVIWTAPPKPNPKKSSDAYEYFELEEAGSSTVGDNSGSVMLGGPGPVLAYTITLPRSPRDGQEIVIASSQQVSVLTLSAPIGSIVGSIGTILKGGFACFKWVLKTSQWYRIG